MEDRSINSISRVFPIDSSMLKSDPKLNGVRSIVKDFSLNTSTHGVAGIARSESKHNCIFWSICVIVFSGVMFYFVSRSISNYFEYPVQTSISFYDQWPQVFPSVTICNYSPLRYDRFISPFLNYTNRLNVTNTNDTTTFTFEQSKYILQYLQYKLNRNESIDEYYYSLQSMLIQCSYNGKNCSSNDFIQFTSSTYGHCYTFNADSNENRVHYNNDYGDGGELQLHLYLHSHQYVPYFYQGVGLLIMVHNNSELPLVDQMGIELTPGRKHRLGYYKRTYYFLSSPYTTCSNEVTPGMKVFFDQFSNAQYNYGVEVCFRVALQTYTYITCGCVSPYQWEYRSIILPSTGNVVYAPLCNMSDNCYSNAADRFQSSESLWATYASTCGLECLTNDFPLKISSVSAPPHWFVNDIKTFVESSSIPLAMNWSEEYSSLIGMNYVGVNVVCESTKVESYTQQATINAVDVLSNVGGQTGLWIGISFLSFMEIAEMIYRLIRHQVKLIHRKINKTGVINIAN